MSEIGVPIRGDALTGNTIVQFEGATMTLEVAEHVGLVKRVNGTYVEVSPEDIAAQEQNKVPEDGIRAEPFAEAVAENALSQVTASLPGPVQDYIAAQLVSGEKLSQSQLSDAAAMAGISPEALQVNLDIIMSGFQSQADKFVQATGISDPQELWDWAHENCSAELKRAMHQHSLSRSPKVYKTIIDRYMQTAPDADAVRNAGVTVKTLDDGTQVAVVRENGQDYEISLAAAAAIGLL
jgi:hypothetical protein